MPAHADTLTIAMVGDIMMGTTFPSQMLPANNGNDLFVDSATAARVPRALARTAMPSVPPHPMPTI